MNSHPHVDILTLWLAQAREEPTMPLDEIRRRAEALDATNRRWRIVTALLVLLILIAEAWQVWTGDETLERAGDLLTMAAFVYVAFRYRAHRRAAPPGTLGTTNSVEFYRAELVRQRDLSKDGWGYLLPFVPGVTLALFGGGLGDRPASQNIALVVFGIALFLGVAWWNAHTARRRQAELDRFDRL